MKPGERKKIVQPGRTLFLNPVHNVTVKVNCSETDLQSVVTLQDCSLQIHARKVQHPEKTIIVLNAPVVIKNLQGQELAVIRHMPKKPST